jgi:hypothetical protein
MKFRIYLRRFGRLIRVYKFHRNANGLYMFSFMGSDNYVTYHQDGKYWIRARGAKLVKKLRQPLGSFRGRETLALSAATFLAAPPHSVEDRPSVLRPSDMVIDLSGPFCVEIILSEDDAALPPLSDRLNSTSYVRNGSPFILVEVFQSVSNVFPWNRYPGPKWVQGVNFFPEDHGRI